MENLQTSLPGWEIVRCIGSGSSGKVYELKKKDEYGGDFHCASGHKRSGLCRKSMTRCSRA